jgi:hypothetical protein
MGWIDVEQPVPSIPNESLQVVSPGHAPPSPRDELNKLWLDYYGHHFYESSPSIPNEPSQVACLGHAPLAPSLGDALTKLWFDLYGHH